jgi:HSP20 family protein
MWTRELPSLTRRNGLFPFESLFDRVFQDAPEFGFATETGVDIFATPEGYGVLLDMPGIDPSKLQVRVEEGCVVVTGERETPSIKDAQWISKGRVDGAVTRRIRIPDDVDADGIKAEYRHGTLALNLPRKEESRPKSVQVKVRD